MAIASLLQILALLAVLLPLVQTQECNHSSNDEFQAALFYISQREIRSSPEKYFGFLRNPPEVQAELKGAWNHCSDRKYISLPSVWVEQIDVRSVDFSSTGDAHIEVRYVIKGQGVWSGGPDPGLWCKVLHIGCPSACYGDVRFTSALTLGVRFPVLNDGHDVEVLKRGVEHRFGGTCSEVAEQSDTCGIFSSRSFSQTIVRDVKRELQKQKMSLIDLFGSPHKMNLSSETVLQYRIGKPELVTHPEVGFQTRVSASLKHGIEAFHPPIDGTASLATVCRDEPQPDERLLTTPEIPLHHVASVRSNRMKLSKRSHTSFLLFDVKAQEGASVRLYSDLHSSWSLQVTIDKKGSVKISEPCPPMWGLNFFSALTCRHHRAVGKTLTASAKKEQLASQSYKAFWISVDHAYARVAAGTGHDINVGLLAETEVTHQSSDLRLFDIGIIWGRPPRIFEIADTVSTWRRFRLKPVCSGWASDVAKGLRLSSFLLSGLYWARTKSAYSKTKHFMDTSFTVALTARHPVVSIKPGHKHFNDSMMLFLDDCSIRASCVENFTSGHNRKKPLLDVAAQSLSGPGYIVALPQRDGSMLVSAQFSHVGHVTSEFLVRTPLLPLPPDSIQNGMRSLLASFLATVNRELSNAGLIIPPNLAAHLPHHAASVHAINSTGVGYFEFRQVHMEREINGVSLTSFTTACSRAASDFLGAFRWMALPSACVLFLLAYHVLWRRCRCRDELGQDIWFLVSALCLLIHGWSWAYQSPFEEFSANNFKNLGLPYAYDLLGVEQVFTQWTSFGKIATVSLAFIHAAIPFRCVRERLAEVLPPSTHCMFFCIADVVIQFYFLVGYPMEHFVGQQLSKVAMPELRRQAISVVQSSSSDASSLAAFLQAAEGRQGTRIQNIISTTISGTFTSVFVSYLGANFTIMLAGLPVGVTLGSLAFALARWSTRRRRGAVDMALLFSIITEFMVSVGMMAPLTTIYQALSGNPAYWIGPLVLCICRPLLTLPSMRSLLVDSAAGPQAATPCPRFLILREMLLCASLLLFGVWLLRSSVNESLEPLLYLQLRAPFVVTLCAITILPVATAQYLALDAMASDDADRVLEEWDGVFRNGLLSLVKCSVCGTAPLHRITGICNSRPMGWGLSEEQWTQVLAGFVWLLSMDAIATFLHHLLKSLLIFLSRVWRCTSGQSPCGHSSSVWDAANHTVSAWVACSAAFCLSCIAAWTISVMYEVWNGSWVRSWARCKRLMASRARGFVARPFGAASLRIAPAADIGRPLLPQGGDRGMVRRQEFLLVGLGHWFLCCLRSWMDWGFCPHDRHAFHERLKIKYHLRLPKGDVTVFDKPWEVYVELQLLSLTISSVSLCALLVAAILDRAGTSRGVMWSRYCVLLVGCLACVSAIIPLLPDYAQRSQISYYATGCAPRYDQYADFVSHAMVGICIAAGLGLSLFSIAFTLPISIVRAIWLSISDENGETRKRMLHGLMKLVACLTPCVLIYPLLFFNQLTEDPDGHKWLAAFWVVPSLLILMYPGHYGKKYAYSIWLICYVLLFGLWASSQLHNLDVDVFQRLKHMDWPWVWSGMHAEFCVANVLLTDIMFLAMRGAD